MFDSQEVFDELLMNEELARLESRAGGRRSIHIHIYFFKDLDSNSNQVMAGCCHCCHALWEKNTKRMKQLN